MFDEQYETQDELLALMPPPILMEELPPGLIEDEM